MRIPLFQKNTVLSPEILEAISKSLTPTKVSGEVLPAGEPRTNVRSREDVEAEITDLLSQLQSQELPKTEKLTPLEGIAAALTALLGGRTGTAAASGYLSGRMSQKERERSEKMQQLQVEREGKEYELKRKERQLSDIDRAEEKRAAEERDRRAHAFNIRAQMINAFLNNPSLRNLEVLEGRLHSLGLEYGIPELAVQPYEKESFGAYVVDAEREKKSAQLRTINNNLVKVISNPRNDPKAIRLAIDQIRALWPEFVEHGIYTGDVGAEELIQQHKSQMLFEALNKTREYLSKNLSSIVNIQGHVSQQQINSLLDYARNEVFPVLNAFGVTDDDYLLSVFDDSINSFIEMYPQMKSLAMLRLEFLSRVHEDEMEKEKAKLAEIRAKRAISEERLKLEQQMHALEMQLKKIEIEAKKNAFTPEEKEKWNSLKKELGTLQGKLKPLQDKIHSYYYDYHQKGKLHPEFSKGIDLNDEEEVRMAFERQQKVIDSWISIGAVMHKREKALQEALEKMSSNQSKEALKRNVTTIKVDKNKKIIN